MKWESRHELCDHLESRGFRMIGDGLFADVFAKPNSDYAIKIAVTCDDWPAYIAWAKINGFLGTFAPAVYSLTVHSECETPFYVAFMERLSCTILETNSAIALDLFESLTIYKWGEFRRFKPHQELPTSWYMFVESLRELQAENGYSWDLHEGNFMTVGDRLVLTDPFGSSTRNSPNAEKTTFEAAALFAKRRHMANAA